MDVRYIEAISKAADSIFQNYFGLPPSILNAVTEPDVIQSQEVSVILGVSGELKGQIICSFNSETAKNIIGLMMGGMEITDLDELGWSAIQEFGNWVAGTSATEMSKEGIIVDVTPPVINEGISTFRSPQPFTRIPLQSDIGTVSIYVTFKKEH